MGRRSRQEPGGERSRRRKPERGSRAGKAWRKSGPERIEKLEPSATSGESPTESTRRRQRPDYGERRRRALRRKRAALGCAGAVGAFMLLAAVAVALYVGAINNKLTGEIRAESNVVQLLRRERPAERNDPFYMLLMGVDSREEGERARSDTLIVARIDPDKKTAALISIPRDTRVNVPGHGLQKINSANAYGGPELVIRTVKDFTGLPISHYVEIDFSGFKSVVDALGGVTVYVPQRINDMKAANHVASAAKLEAGEQRLDGAHALTFVRSRAFPRGDLQRVENQQAFLKALVKETLRVTNALRLPSVVDAVAQNVTTDMSVGDLLRVANQMKDMQDEAIETATMPGEPKMIGGGSYVICDEEAFKEMLSRFRDGRSIENIDDEGNPDPSTPEEVSVTIRNGAGIAGVGADAARKLRGHHFDVDEVGNMNQFVYDESLIVYKTNKGPAELVAGSLGRGRVVPSRGMYAFDSDVLLVVGKDWGVPEPLRTLQLIR